MPNGKLHTRRAELVLSRPGYEMLAVLDMRSEPLSGFAAAMERVLPGECAEVAISLLPLSPGKQRRTRRRLLKDAQRAEMANPLDVVRGIQDRYNPAERAQRSMDMADLKEKLTPGNQLWQAQVLIRVDAFTKEAARARISALLAAFAPYRARNWWRVAGSVVLGAAYLGTDLPLFAQWFDYRLRTGLHAARAKNIVSTQEIAAFLKPPTKSSSAVNIVRSAGYVPPAPASLPRYIPDRRGVLPLGEVTRPNGAELAGVSLDETLFALVVGRAGWGKSTLAQLWSLHLALTEGAGIYYVDPHDDGIRKIKAFLAGCPDEWSRVDEINFAHSAVGAQPGFNLFDVQGLSLERQTTRPAVVTDAIAAAMGWDLNNAPRALNFITQAAYSLVELAKLVPREVTPTLFQLVTILTNEEWREAVALHLSAPLRGFWCDRFPNYKDDSILPVTNLLDQLRQHPGMKTLLGQSATTFDARRAIDTGRIVLVAPGPERIGKFLANLIVYDLLRAAMSRVDLPEDRRRPAYALLDELQKYDVGGEGYVADLLREARKFMLRAFAFTQDPMSLTQGTRRALLQNRSHLLVSASSAEAAALMAKQWSPQDPEPETLTSLPKFAFVADVETGSRRGGPDPFLVRTVPPEAPTLWGDIYHPEAVERLEAAITSNAQRRTPEQVEDHLATLDDRILEALASRGRPSSNGHRPIVLPNVALGDEEEDDESPA